MRWALGVHLAVTLCSVMSLAQPPSVTAPGKFAIAGVIVNYVTGQPVSGAGIIIASTNARNQIQKLTTGPDGRFAFPNLPLGKYSLEASAKGYREQGLDQHEYFATAVAVGPELDSEHIVFRLQPDASVEGHVTDENNEPIEGANVQLFLKEIQDGQQKAVLREGGTTDDRGYFHIGHLPYGNYYLAVSARPWYAQNYRPAPPQVTKDDDALARAQQEASELDKAYPLTFYPNVPDSAGASAIFLHPGDHFQADVAMQAVNAVHLRVRTGSLERGGEPQVVLKQRIFDRFEPSLQGISMSRTEPGVIDIFGLAPGHYLIEAQMPNEPSDKATTRGWFQEIELAGDAEVNAAGNPGFAELSGTIRFEGAPDSSGFIDLMNTETGERYGTELSPKGEFSFPGNQLRTGNYEVMVESGHPGFALQKMTATGAAVTGHTVEITGPATVHLAGIASHGLGQVNGTALRDGKPVAGVMIVLVPDDPAHNQSLVRRDQSDSDGTFTLPTVVPGSYTVLALSDGWQLEWSNPAVLKPYLKGGEPVRVAGDSKLNIKVTVQ